jgi:hypothetical protein
MEEFNMKPLEDIYKASFFKNRHKLHWRAEHVCRAISITLGPDSVVDVGCATGDLVECFNNSGVKAYGIEGSSNAEPFLTCGNHIFFLDVRKKLNLDERFDLCICFEVAEHIEKEYSDQFVDNLVSLSDKILISAAPPGQGGHYHVNCQPYEYWEDKFRTRGYNSIEAIADMVKKELYPWRKKPGIKAYFNNLLYFERRNL